MGGRHASAIHQSPNVMPLALPCLILVLPYNAMPPMPVAGRYLMPAPDFRILASGIKHPIPPPVPGNQDVAGEFVKICIFDLAVWETELS